MEDEVENERRSVCEASPVLRVVGALERVRPLPQRHPLLARIVRSARAVLDHRLDDPAAALNSERAMLLFSSTAPESRISRVLGRDSAASNISRSAQDNGNCEAPEKRLRLSGSHAIGPRTMVDGVIEGTRIQLMELRFRVLHTPSIPRLGDGQGQITLTGGSDLHCRHRVAVESMMGSRDDRHSVSSIVSTDFSSPLAWGVATSHKLGRDLSLFSRYSSDRYAGRRVILQAVQRRGRNTISPICSIASKGRVQAGITWKRTFLCNKENRSEDFFQLKALCSQKGVFSVFLRAQIGDPLDESRQ